MKELIAKMEANMEKTMEALNRDLGAVRAGRANPAVLDKISVDYWGTPTPIQQMAAVSVAEARILVIQPWDANSLKEIERAILASDIGINPQNDGKVIRLTFPPLTEERRKDLVKEVRGMAETAKVSLRSIRRDYIEKSKQKKKDGDFTEDDVAICEKKIQDVTDKFTKEVDTLVSAKEKEIMDI